VLELFGRGDITVNISLLRQLQFGPVTAVAVSAPPQPGAIASAPKTIEAPVQPVAMASAPVQGVVVPPPKNQGNAVASAPPEEGVSVLDF
jgi:hypothetical protein